MCLLGENLEKRDKHQGKNLVKLLIPLPEISPPTPWSCPLWVFNAYKLGPLHIHFKNGNSVYWLSFKKKNLWSGQGAARTDVFQHLQPWKAGPVVCVVSWCPECFITNLPWLGTWSVMCYKPGGKGLPWHQTPLSQLQWMTGRRKGIGVTCSFICSRSISGAPPLGLASWVPQGYVRKL